MNGAGERQQLNDARERGCAALLELVVVQGYEATSVEEIVERAGLGPEEFERLFGSKEGCAIALFDELLADFNREVAEAYESAEGWPDSLRAAAYAVADWMQAHPREARFGAVDLLWAGELAQARREEAFQRFIGMIDAGRELAEEPERVPTSAAEGVIGSIAEMITKRVQRGKVDPHEFVPELMYMAVLPYLGEECAARELTVPPPE